MRVDSFAFLPPRRSQGLKLGHEAWQHLYPLCHLSSVWEVEDFPKSVTETSSFPASKAILQAEGGKPGTEMSGKNLQDLLLFYIEVRQGTQLKSLPGKTSQDHGFSGVSIHQCLFSLMNNPTSSMGSGSSSSHQLRTQ